MKKFMFSCLNLIPPINRKSGPFNASLLVALKSPDSYYYIAKGYV